MKERLTMQEYIGVGDCLQLPIIPVYWILGIPSEGVSGARFHIA